MPRILGIESSCDETAAAVVEDARRILSSVVASQLDVHGKYGGVVPELASREHLRAITPVVRQALTDARTCLRDLDAVAVTCGPGLVGSLLVGLTYAKALCAVSDLPLIGVNHIEGHIHAVLLEAGAVELPALALVASGGHTHLFEVLVGQALSPAYRLLGKTRDDAAGEAYDKVAKLLGFSYPGGPVLDRLAEFGDAGALRLPLSKMKGNPLDFSFSGLKTAVLRWTESRDMAAEIECRRALLRANPHPSIDEWRTVTPQLTLDAIAAFQRVVIEELLRRTARAAGEIGALPCPVYFPTPGLSTDNAAMIAAAAFPRLQRRAFDDLTLSAQANLTLA